MADLEVQDADITKLDVDAIANAANTDLRHGGGVAGAIVRAGGRTIQDESDRLSPIGLGEAVATGAGELPARWVIHAATMHLGGPTSADAIRAATASTLAVADELGARSLGLVAFGTGVGGFSVSEAARIEVEEVRRYLAAGGALERIVFCVFGDDARRAFEGAVASWPGRRRAPGSPRSAAASVRNRAPRPPRSAAAAVGARPRREKQGGPPEVG